MKKKRARRRKNSADSGRRRKVFLEIVGAILIAGALFWGLFYVNTIEVVGNSGKNYSDQQIIDMSLSEFWTKNSVLLRMFRRRVDLKDVRFMESVEVEFRSRNEIRLHVNEKKPVGYVRLNDRDYYFDHEGVVLESMSADETAQLKQQNMETVPEEVLPEGTEAVPEEEDAVEEFNPTLADVPMIAGIEVSQVEVGQRLPLSNPGFFNTIQFLTKMIDKYGIQPDYVEVAENARGTREMTLHYGTIRAALGTDSGLEEKVTRLAAILPKLAGRSGVLHLEEYTSDTINIVFEEDR